MVPVNLFLRKSFLQEVIDIVEMAKRKRSSNGKQNGPLVEEKRPRLQLSDLPMV